MNRQVKGDPAPAEAPTQEQRLATLMKELREFVESKRRTFRTGAESASDQVQKAFLEELEQYAQSSQLNAQSSQLGTVHEHLRANVGRLFMRAKCRMFDLMKSKKSRNAPLSDVEEPSAPFHACANNDLQCYLDQFLKDARDVLEIAGVEAFELHYLYGVHQGDIAERMGCARQTVNRYIAEVVVALHNWLDERRGL